MLRDDSRDLAEMLDPLEEVRDTGTNVFEILDLEDNEKRLTRFLAWILDPSGSHDGGKVFLNSFLAAFVLEPEHAKSVSVTQKVC